MPLSLDDLHLTVSSDGCAIKGPRSPKLAGNQDGAFGIEIGLRESQRTDQLNPAHTLLFVLPERNNRACYHEGQAGNNEKSEAK